MEVLKAPRKEKMNEIRTEAYYNGDRDRMEKMEESSIFKKNENLSILLNYSSHSWEIEGRRGGIMVVGKDGMDYFFELFFSNHSPILLLTSAWCMVYGNGNNADNELILSPTPTGLDSTHSL